MRTSCRELQGVEFEQTRTQAASTDGAGPPKAPAQALQKAPREVKIRDVATQTPGF